MPWQWCERVEQEILGPWLGADRRGNGRPALELLICNSMGLALDAQGDLLVSDRVRRVDPSGRISTVAGTGVQRFSPDGTPATEARLDMPWGLGLDLEERLLIGDGGNHRVRRIERTAG